MDRFTVRLSSAHKPSGNTKPLVFKNPILTASGTFGYGVEFANYGDLTHLGGIVVKGLSLKPRPGNPLPRVAETPCGMLNAVGLQNDGVESFLKNKLPRLPWHETPVIANLYATSPAEFAELAGILAAEEGIAGLEVNISCPNVKNGGVLFGQDPVLAAEVTEAVKKHAGNLPVIVKLSPNVTDITAIAKAAEQAGADAISCINTITGMGVDVKTRKPLLANVVGGLSGPAVKPVALRFVQQLRTGIPGVEISGIGGIETWEDAAEFLLLGSTTLQVTTSIMQYGYRIVEDMKNGLEHYMEEQGVDSLMDLIGIANGNIIPAEELDRDYVVYPEFDTEKCIGCGRCYVSCYDGAHQAISWDEENRKPSCDHNKCVGCHLCALVCPVKAIGKGEIVMKPGRKGSPADKAV